MPQITDNDGKPSNFTDNNVARLKVDATTWFTDPACKGLRLCVTAGGTKTWFLNKWDPTAQKTRAVKLGQWNARGTHCAWAKKEVGETALAITKGAIKNRKEKADEAAAITAERATIPTLRQAFERDMKWRRNRGESYGGPIHDKTDKEYCRSFNQYLGTWADKPVTEVDHAAMQRMLDDLAEEKPFAAHKVNIVLGFTFERAERLIAARLPFLPPSLKKNPKMQQREIDFTIPWADRWKEIEGVENEHKRLLWQVRWFTGQREEMLRALTWSDIDLDAGTMMARTGQKKVKEKRLIAMADQVKEWFVRLHEIKYDDSDLVFPSRRIMGDKRDALGPLDRLPLSAAGDMRHLWDEATHDVDTREMVLRWLTGHSLVAGETKSLGFYGVVPVERQRKVANEIASVISTRIGMTPANVVELAKARA